MRNVLVVLVPLCFGLSSGFIVPTGVQEVTAQLKDDFNSIDSSANRKRMLFLTTKTILSSTAKTYTENNNNSSLDKDVYEYSEKKESVVKERAYIYMNENPMKPIRNRIYESPIKIPQLHSHRPSMYLNTFFDDLPDQLTIGYISQNLNLKDCKCQPMKTKQKQKKSNPIKQEFKKLPNENQDFTEIYRNPVYKTNINHNDNIADSKYLGVEQQTLESFNALYYPFASNIIFNNLKTRQKNYLSSVKSDTHLLDQLIKQKIDEKSSLFMGPDCGQPKKVILISRDYSKTTCICCIRMLSQQKKNKLRI